MSLEDQLLAIRRLRSWHRKNVKGSLRVSDGQLNAAEATFSRLIQLRERLLRASADTDTQMLAEELVALLNLPTVLEATA